MGVSGKNFIHITVPKNFHPRFVTLLGDIPTEFDFCSLVKQGSLFESKSPAMLVFGDSFPVDQMNFLFIF